MAIGERSEGAWLERRDLVDGDRDAARRGELCQVRRLRDRRRLVGRRSGAEKARARERSRSDGVEDAPRTDAVIDAGEAAAAVEPGTDVAGLELRAGELG